MTTLIPLLLLTIACGAPVEGAQKIFRYSATEHNGAATTGRAYNLIVSGTQIRKDSERQSLILDSEAGRVHLVDHALKETFELDHPFRRNEIVSDEVIEVYRYILSQYKAEIIDVSIGEESTTIAGRKCQDHRIQTLSLDGQTDDVLTVCLTLKPSPEAALFWRLMEVESELIPGMEQVWQYLSEIGTFPLRWQFDLDKNQRRFTYTWLLTEIEVVAEDPAAFLPNPDYKRSAPDPEGRFISRPRPLPGS